MWVVILPIQLGLLFAAIKGTFHKRGLEHVSDLIWAGCSILYLIRYVLGGQPWYYFAMHGATLFFWLLMARYDWKKESRVERRFLHLMPTVRMTCALCKTERPFRKLTLDVDMEKLTASTAAAAATPGTRQGDLPVRFVCVDCDDLSWWERLQQQRRLRKMERELREWLPENSS